MVDASQEWTSDWTSGPAYAEVVKQREAEAQALADEMAESQYSASYVQNFTSSFFDGEKYPGGLSPVNELFGLDYWGLRARSNELFHKNPYARGIVRRIVTNVIFDGLHLEAVPEASMLNKSDDELDDWSENVESRYFLYNETPEIIDYKRRRTGGELQAQILTEAIIGGDCLQVHRQSPKYRLPTVQIVSGDRIQSPPLLKSTSGNDIIDGVEVDDAGRHVAFYVTDDKVPGGYQRILARGSRTGRLQAKLIYGCDKREDGVRGVPLLGIAIQPLAEIDRHRDSAQRKATLKAMVVAAIERDPNFKGPKSKIGGKGASRKGSAVDVELPNGEARRVAYADMLPGVHYEQFNPGEKINYFSDNGADINFGAFEAAIIMGVAWALEIPPEILLLSFNKNYSASQAAINEFKIYLDKERKRFGAQSCNFLYEDWFLSMVLLNRIDADRYLQDYMTADRWEYARAWTMADWAGHVKPSTDMLKAVNAHRGLIEIGASTYARSTRELTGMKFSRNARQIKREVQMLVEAMRPMAEFDAEKQSMLNPQAVGVVEDDNITSIEKNKKRELFNMSEDEVKRAKMSVDTYGVLVRAGAATPQTEDEDYFRSLFGMADMSKNARELWKTSGGVRRPITLAKEEAQTAEEVDSGEIEDPDTTDETEKSENQEGAA